MSSFQTALSSARFNRYLMWFSGLVLAAGVAFLAIKLVPGSDKQSRQTGRRLPRTATGEERAADEREGRAGQDVRGARSGRSDDDPHVPRHRGRAEAPRQVLGRDRSVDEAGLHVPVVVAREGAPGRSVSDRERRLDAVLPRLRVDEGDPPRGRRLGPGCEEDAADCVPARARSRAARAPTGTGS